MSNTKSQKRSRSRAGQHPRTAEQFFAKPQASQDAWTRSLEVISKMRKDHVSLRAASKEIGVRSETVTRLAASALRKRSNGQYVAKPGDQLLRVLRILTPDGPIEVGIRGSRQASTVGEYWAAAHKYIATGDATALDKLQGKTIRDASGKNFTLITDTRELKRIGNAGQLSFESIYARTA